MKSYKNIGTLDLRKATNEALKEIYNMENIGVIISHEEQTTLINDIKQSNIGSVISLEEGVQLVMQNGAYKVTKNMLENLETDIYLVINGKLNIEPIGDAQLLGKIRRGVVNGRVVIMEDDFGVLAGKLQINGDSMIYKAGERLVEGKFTLEDDNLYGVTAGTKMVVSHLIALDSFDEALFNETFENIRILGSLVVSRENIKKIAGKIENYLEIEKHVLSPEYQYFDKLTIDAQTIRNIKSPKLYIRGKLTVEISAEALLESVTGIICNTLEVNESDYNEVLSIVEKAETVKVIDPEAVTNLSAMKISDYYLKSMDTLNIANYGALKFDESITPEALEEKLIKIENFGSIKCPESLYGIIMKKVKINHGVIKAYNPEKEAATETETQTEDQLQRQVISNLGTYEL